LQADEDTLEKLRSEIALSIKNRDEEYQQLLAAHGFANQDVAIFQNLADPITEQDFQTASIPKAAAKQHRLSKGDKEESNGGVKQQRTAKKQYFGAHLSDSDRAKESTDDQQPITALLPAKPNAVANRKRPNKSLQPATHQVKFHSQHKSVI
jgi:hypothetical protein